MRLHSLRVVAFGPFVDAVTVDFDALSDAGLFLLTGATGAGKTSVLDAVCFALYGDVPGDRSVARRLRSDHAAPGVAPEVSLEATLAGRRFRFVRSPAWVRPKKRGTGTTTQQASVTLSELIGDQWHPVSSRLDEVGDLVGALLGMSLTQFCQVAMLPQGRFQAFLRARADERQAVLQQLFHTGRFARAESWLRDHRLGLQRDSRQHHEKVVALVNRLSEATGQAVPDDWDLQSLERVAADGALLHWAQALTAQAETSLAASAESLPGVVAAEEAARIAVEHSTRIRRHQERHSTATRAQAELQAQSERHHERISQLAAAQRAAAVMPLVRIAEQAEWDASAARVRTGAAWETLLDHLDAVAIDEVLQRSDRSPDLVADLRRVPGPHDSAAVDAVEDLRGLLQVRLLALEGLRDCDARVRVLAEAVAAAGAELQQARDLTAVATGRVQELPGRIDGLRAALTESREAATAAGAREQVVTSLTDRLDAIVLAERLEGELATAAEARTRCREQVQDLTQAWLDLREARLHGMAAEIAGSLAVGGSCPVCGSCSHPQPARPTPGAPDAALEREALRAVDDAKSVLHAHDEQVHQLDARLQVALNTAGGHDADDLRAQLIDARRLLAEAEDARSRVPGLTADLADVEEYLSRAQQELRDREVTESRLQAQHQARRQEHDALAARRDEVLAGTRIPSVTALLDLLQTTVDQVDAFLSLHARGEEATDRLRQQERALDQCLTDHGFATAVEVTHAFREEAACEALRRLVADHQRDEARWQGVLDDPELRAAVEQPEPDLERLGQEHEQCRRRAQELAALHTRASAVVERLTSLTEELDAALVSWSPLREKLGVASDLSAFVEGKSADNRLQVRLSAYVLGYRLSQVVEAANLRLATMSDGRYTLEHTGQRANRETRGGLGLLVRDDWSGEPRDPATLSGGETFVVSLALALGLADVITEEAGGADLDTLFVDEGFGSLDADTLDDVLDTLDALRGGGRVVGLVSHVTEMRERIPTQLQVLKARSGSTIAMVQAV